MLCKTFYLFLNTQSAPTRHLSRITHVFRNLHKIFELTSSNIDLGHAQIYNSVVTKQGEKMVEEIPNAFYSIINFYLFEEQNYICV